MPESPAYRVLSQSAHRAISRLELELCYHGGRAPQSQVTLTCHTPTPHTKNIIKNTTQKSRPLPKAAYTQIVCPKLLVRIGNARLGICLGRARWLRRQLKHRCLLTLT